jgi:hypothetical protein
MEEVLKNPAKFAAKSVSKGAEVAWSKLSPVQKKAMAEAKQLEVSRWVQQKVCERFKCVMPQNRLMRTLWVLVSKPLTATGPKSNARHELCCLDAQIQTSVIWRQPH